MASVKILQSVSALLVCFLILALATPSAFAALRHENPDDARQTFSGPSLFRYYSDTLDMTLKNNPLEVEKRLARMPFANLPKSLEDSTGKFAATAVEVSYLTADIDRNISKMKTLLRDYRLAEFTELSTMIVSDLARADVLTGDLNKAMEAIGKELLVHSATSNTELKAAFNDVLKKIGGLDALIVSNTNQVSNLQKAFETVQKLVLSTEVTLRIGSDSAFVGDTIGFEGRLTSEGRPLPGREVAILVNGSPVAAAATGEDGYYEGSLKVPGIYAPEIDIQALYVAGDSDIGLYVSSVSPLVRLKVLFYNASFDIAVTDKAFPGLEKEIRGRLDYGRYPVLSARKIRIHMDDIVIGEEMVEPDFFTRITIRPDMSLGKHTLTLSASADGRYSEVTTSAVLNVSRAVPSLDIDLPVLALVPGSMRLRGKLVSEVGPLKGASVNVGMGESQVLLVTQDDGSFEGRIGMKMALDLIGTRSIGIQVSPQEPWNAPMSTTKNLVMVNMVNSGIVIMLIIVFRRAFLPGLLRRTLTRSRRRSMRPKVAVVTAQPLPAQSYRSGQLSAAGDKEPGGSTAERMLYFYKLLIRLIERVTRKFMSPQHTLREFANENGKVLGPLYTYFLELTRIVEKVRYSRYTPSEQDVLSFEQLSRNVESGLESRNG